MFLYTKIGGILWILVVPFPIQSVVKRAQTFVVDPFAVTVGGTIVAQNFV